MSRKYRILFLILILPIVLFSQKNISLEEGNDYSTTQIIKFSTSNNAYNFMAMGYYLDANNIMYKATNDKKYLDYNLLIINNVLNTYLPSSKNYKPWLMRVAENNQNYVVNGQEHIVSEGYFFRYLGEFIYIIQNENLYQEQQQDFISGLKYAFDKWNQRSLAKYNDQSLLFSNCFDVGANWSVVAMYIDEFLAKNEDTIMYKAFYNKFNEQLKLAVAENSVLKNDKLCYVWNSTYPTRFTKYLKDLKSYNVVKEDVSHANHTINFVLTTVLLKKYLWDNDDLRCFLNTIMELVWIPSQINFTDNIDGTSKSKMANTGWKQSDGYMKLMSYNSLLYPIYIQFLNKNTELIINSSLGLQYQADLIYYDSSYNK